MIGDTKRSVTADNILAVRELRKAKFPGEIFDEFAWNMLLVLFVGMARNEIISELTLIDRADASVIAGRRWIAHLIATRQVRESADNDLVLTDTAIDHMRSFLDGAETLNRRTASA